MVAIVRTVATTAAFVFLAWALVLHGRTDAKAVADPAVANRGVSYMDPMDVAGLGVMGMVAD